MIFHPGILALLLGSALTTSMLCYSAYEGVRIIRNWDIRSGSERQLELERRTYLVSTVMSYVLGFQLLSLFLFIYTADTLSPLFIGAMCAAGSLNVNGFGYSALVLKIVSCLLAGLWLVVNFTDNRAYDYPLIRKKYWLLLFITPFLIAETSVQAGYLLGLRPNIITSCCGTLFSTDAKTVMSEFLALPRLLSEAAFFLSAPITVALGLYVYLRSKGAYLFSIVSFIHFLISIGALISFISIYFYELPTHHCPFCILHPEYGYVGYPMYLAILVSAVSGLGTGIINPFRNIASLCNVIPRIQKRLALISILSNSAFVLIAGYGILFSNLSMAAY
ncbi:MAG: hypothetical protein KJ900_16100 [Proteobacteria bacterium]|jgi:hypothetical protein|nr:hypothetical protein [Desulfocapsa sp.]MBU3945320.1 hypothetical protein [Pseudomonadota bacterium]MCG2744617.1 hypothetical protein [Desulfobacteraceae bacterium]MBU4028660.1 hypothetical protein [Pseudomonadota bacterium]MBU4044390.1 hypothetical protein [Pseudomonadota bacterium]